jgi:TctA family transporter
VLRFTFGIPELSDGIGFVVVAMGMFGTAEIIANLDLKDKREVFLSKVTHLYPTKEDLKRSWASILRGTALGSCLGILPGGGRAARLLRRLHAGERRSPAIRAVRQGRDRGRGGPESANNAGAQTSFIPMLTLGIPGNAVMALMIGALMIQGIAPGPQVMNEKPQLFWGLIASMWVGNLMLVVLNLPMIGMWVKLLTVPYRYLYPSILVFMAIGVFSLSNNPFDVLIMAVFGVLGLHLRQARVRAGADDSRLHPGPADGGKPAPRDAPVPRRPVRLLPEADQPGLHGRLGDPARDRGAADDPQEARRGVRRRVEVV